MTEFLQALDHFIMTWLDPIGVVLGLIVTVPIFWTLWEVTAGKKNRERRWLRETRKHPGQRPAILIIDLLPGKDIGIPVENFRQQDEGLKAIPLNRIIRISHNKKLSPDDMLELLREIRKQAALIITSGVDTLHYFHAGPAIVAAAVGAEFSNSCRVILYQRNSATGSYDNFGPMRLEE